MISPARTESGYRKFSSTDMDRLRFVLTMQRDHYLPLKVIRGYLDELDAGRKPELPGAVTGPIPTILPTDRRYRREDLIREAHASQQLLNDAVSASLIIPAEHYSESTLQVLKSLVELQRSGIEPRHLRGFRASAERELGLIESALIPISHRKDSSSRAKASELARDIAGQLEVIRSNLIRSALSRLD